MESIVEEPRREPKRLLVWRFLDAGNNEGLGTLSMSAPT